MIHNPPYALDKMIVEKRQFEDVLKQTYSRLDSLELQLRESIGKAVKRFTNDPTDAIQWLGEAVIENQTTLSIVTEIRILLNNAKSLESVPELFAGFISHYQNHVLAWARHGENCTSAMTNTASRATLTATAKLLDSFGLGSEIERAIRGDIEETKKRVVVLEFVDLKVDDHFRTSPDLSTMLYRKLSPRKATECVYPVTKATTHSFGVRDKVYMHRVPLESDVVHVEPVAA